MSSQQKTVDYILEQCAGAGEMTAKKMFGEYGLYCDGKVFAFVGNDQLFLKPTEAGRAYIGDVTEAPAYEGSKMYFLIDGDRWDDADWMAGLVSATANELPAPKPKGAKKG